MSKIKKFQFKNIRSYGNKMVDIPFDMDNGLVLISGKNGGGKTSIVEALEFAIYGKSSRVPVKDLPNWINDNAFTSVEFETDDNRIVQLSRGISPDFYDLKVGGAAYSSKTKSENKAGKNKIDKMVEEELFALSQDIFANNVLLSVQDFKSFIKMKAADKRKIIDKIFDTDIFNDMLVKLKEELSELKKKQVELSAEIESKRDVLNTTNAHIDELKASISDDVDAMISMYQNKITELEGALSDSSDELSAKQSEFDSLTEEYNSEMKKHNEDVHDAYRKYESSISAIYEDYKKATDDYAATGNAKMSEDIASIELEKQSKISEIPDVENSIKTRISEIESKIEKVRTIIEEFKCDVDLRSSKIKSELDSAKNESLSDAKTLYDETVSRIKKSIAEIESGISLHEKSLLENGSALQTVLVEMSVVKNKLDLYNNDKCPECGGDLHDSFHEDEKNKLTARLKHLLSEQSSINNSINDTNSKISELKSSLELENSNLNDASNNYSLSVSGINSSYTIDLNSKMSALNVEMSSMNEKANGKIEQFNLEISNIRNSAKQEYDKAASDINGLYNEKIFSLRSQYAEAFRLFEIAQKNDMEAKKQAESDAFSALKSELDKTHAEIDEKYSSGIENSKNMIKVLGENNKQLREALNDLKIKLVAIQNGDATKTITELSRISDSLNNDISSIMPELEGCEHKIKIRENVQALIGENGLKKMIMRNILPQFNASIQRITSLFDFKYRFIFDDNFDAHLSYCGKEVPITVSRGEEKIMDIIVILSTLQLILLKHPNINMLFLDEIFSNLDVENIAKAVSILKDYSKKYNLMVFVMSHTTVPVELFDKTINISFDGSFSSLEIN